MIINPMILETPPSAITKRDKGPAVAEAQHHLHLKQKSRTVQLLEAIANKLKPRPIGPREKMHMLKSLGPDRRDELLNDLTEKREANQRNT